VYAPGGRSARLSTLSARSVYRRESAVDFERLEGVQVSAAQRWERGAA
jgi:hypothetical protein